jgi:hypothetical protein
VPRQGARVRADEGRRGGRAVELRRRARAGARRGAQSVHHTSHEEWARRQGQEKGGRVPHDGMKTYVRLV